MVIAVVGGGAAGMMAALSAKREDPSSEVVLLEKNEKLGKKIFITGKGRGNFTNSRDIQDFFPQYIRNPLFLRPALQAFSNKDLIDLMEKGGCRCREERGGRVFPASGHAFSITDCLKRSLKREGVLIRYGTRVKQIEMKEGRVQGVILGDGSFLRADRVIVSTGGLSYPSTGSTGDGYRFALDAGLEVTNCYPSLTYLVPDEDVAALNGLRLKNIELSVRNEDGKSVYKSFGELEFVPGGIGGPLALSASCVTTSVLNGKGGGSRRFFSMHIDLKPALSEQQLLNRLARDFSSSGGKSLERALEGLLPARLTREFLRRLRGDGIDGRERAADSSKETRRRIVSLLKDYCYTIRGTGTFREAIVTQGGVSVKEIDPRTMESHKVRGLFFAGEVLDVDAYTGGFNMQAAFSTGYLAGRSAAGIFPFKATEKLNIS